MRRLPLVLGLLALVAVVVVGLSQAGSNDKPKNSAPSPAEIARAFRGSPPPLAALHRQANGILGGGLPALEARLKSLRGVPVVVNKWASWCGPCKFEFPFLQELAVKYGRRVAFVGLNTGDNTANARRFLSRFPVSYPSFSDPDEKLADALKASKNFPSTLFLDRDGQLNFQHQGAYADATDLEDDIRRYALGS
jgi:cytochrome c biogenesis protein CcmG, thiol:disulfide interchange protein DsbE